jgi:hypothetical protein
MPIRDESFTAEGAEDDAEDAEMREEGDGSNPIALLSVCRVWNVGVGVPEG